VEADVGRCRFSILSSSTTLSLVNRVNGLFHFLFRLALMKSKLTTELSMIMNVAALIQPAGTNNEFGRPPTTVNTTFYGRGRFWYPVSYDAVAFALSVVE
jgi:hypothetical protein